VQLKIVKIENVKLWHIVATCRIIAVVSLVLIIWYATIVLIDIKQIKKATQKKN